MANNKTKDPYYSPLKERIDLGITTGLMATMMALALAIVATFTPYKIEPVYIYNLLAVGWVSFVGFIVWGIRGEFKSKKIAVVA